MLRLVLKYRFSAPMDFDTEEWVRGWISLVREKYGKNMECFITQFGNAGELQYHLDFEDYTAFQKYQESVEGDEEWLEKFKEHAQKGRDYMCRINQTDFSKTYYS